MDPDTDNDGLIDGMRYLAGNFQSTEVEITRLFLTQVVTDEDGLQISWNILRYATGSNASNPDTDGDGLDDQFEATGGGGTLLWPAGGEHINKRMCI